MTEKQFPVEEHVLENGLRIVLAESHDIPTVAVAVYYDVGSRNEKPGKTGFAHLFEHMMFEGSENVPKTMHMRYVSAAGGSMNGTTSEERTNYYETLPAGKLPLALWLEADRMRSLKITSENFENQRETVKEERRQGVDNQPYGETWLRIREAAISNWAYSHPVIGSMEDLDAADVEDARRFFKTYYAPNNAVLSIAGDFEPAEALDLAKNLFGDIPSADPPDPVDETEAEQPEEKLVEITDPKIALPGVVTTYKVPRRRHPDSYALSLLKIVLFDGRSARIFKRTVEDEQLAVECAAYVEQNRGPSLFPMWFISSGNDVSRLKKAVDEEIEKVHDKGVTQRELQRARNSLKSAFAGKAETALGRAMIAGEFKLFDGDPSLINTEIERYMDVGLDDIERTVGKYLVPKNRTVLDVVPAGPGDGNGKEGN